MRIYDIIQKKRRGYALSREEIEFFINGYTKGEIFDYQASALCMAICCMGAEEHETAYLTDAMMNSGDTVDLSLFGELSVDKHSTGGVGDKTSLIIGPVIAALGGKFAKMSGRGLGHTGGTIDKLESIPGYKTTIDRSDFLAIVNKVGMCIIGQSGELAPADKKLYALRDVTATVDSIPLIASSVMSKKLASGAKSILLDVKCGSGAFMKTATEARELADMMISVGEKCGRNVRAIVTNMDLPLGYCIGNALEVKEAVSVLRGESKADLYELCVILCANLVEMFKKISEEESKRLVKECIESGAAFEKMKEWISAQEGDASYIDNTDKLPSAPYSFEIKSDCSGYISHMDAEGIGSSAAMLGAGRISKDDVIDPSAGIVLKYKTGDFVNKNDTIAVLYSSKQEFFENAANRFSQALKFSTDRVDKPNLLL